MERWTVDQNFCAIKNVRTMQRSIPGHGAKIYFSVLNTDYALTFNRPVHIMCAYLPCEAGGKYAVIVMAGHKAQIKK